MTKSSNMTIFDYLDNDIEQFKKDPPSKITYVRPNSKFAKDYLYHIYEHVKTLSDEESIKDYLSKKREYIVIRENTRRVRKEGSWWCVINATVRFILIRNRRQTTRNIYKRLKAGKWIFGW